jgi:Raf kinase inhibitor-like YbhB/YbcL family protein
VRITRPVGLPATVVLAVFAIAACGGSNQAATVAPSAAPPAPSSAPVATTSISPSTPASAAASPSQQESKMPFTLTSTAFKEDGAIPRKYSCDGQDVSPPLSWEGAPDGTGALALIVDDPDANGFVHWVVFDLTASQSGGLAEGVSQSPDAPTQGRNGFGRIGWGGPCPPSGTHHYRFTLYSLDGPLGLTGTPSANDVRHAAEGHVLAQVKLTATYRRGG